jgi:hypothetical protein
VPDYIVSRAPIPVDQTVTAPDSISAAKKAGTVFAKGMEGDGQSAFPVYVLRVPDPVERFDVTVTATVKRDVVATPTPPPPPPPPPVVP